MLPETITKTDLALVLGISKQALDNLEKRNVVRKIGRGTYAFPKAAQDVFAHYREIAAGRASENEDVDLVTERALLAREQRRAQEIKNAALTGDLIEVSVVERTWATVLSSIRSRMLALPTDLAALMAHLTRHDIQTIDRALRDALSEAADDIGADR